MWPFIFNECNYLVLYYNYSIIINANMGYITDLHALAIHNGSLLLYHTTGNSDEGKL